MADTDYDAEFDKAFEGFGEDEKALETPPAETPPATPPVVADPPKPVEEPKKDEPTPPVEEPKKEEATPPATDEKKPEEGAEPPKAPETPPAPEEPKPLTEDSVRSIITDIRTEERTSSKAIEDTTKEVLDAYYPDGLSNVLTTGDGKQLKSPQDVVDASGGTMSMEDAAQWLMNEQFKLDKELDTIKTEAENIAKTTVNFKRDSIAALQKYEPLFTAYPHLQKKVFDKLMKQTKVDEAKGVVLSAPDVMEHYDDYLEPYQLAFEHSTQKSATNPVPPEAPETPPVVAPGADDRLDEGGDGGPAPVNDPNDFAQQVNKELAKGM